MKQRILIIEDNPKNLKIMVDLLTYHGFGTLEAQDGESGIEMAIREKPDLILMDVQLPRIDGYEATKRFKSNEETKNIPVIIVTSFAMKNEEERAREVGCDEYVSKPIDIKKFVETVKKFLPGKQER